MEHLSLKVISTQLDASSMKLSAGPPPSLEILQTLVAGRGTDSSEEQARRFEKAKDEMKSYTEYHYTIRNEALERAVQELQAVMMAERVRTTHVDPAKVFR